MDQRLRLAALLIWFTPVFWAVNFVIARKAPGVIEPYTLALGRWGLAGLILTVASWRDLVDHRAHLRATWYQYLVLGFLGMMVCGAWVYMGAKTTGAMNIALIYSASPVLIAVGAVFLLGERFSARQVVGVLLALIGVVHVVVKGQWMALSSISWVAGDAWILAATVAWALYALLQKIWPSDLSATARLAAICMGGSCILLPFAGHEMLAADTPAWSARATWLVISAALLPGIAAYWIYAWSQKVLGASRAAVTLYLNPLYAALVAWGVLGEPLGWHHLAGAVCILSGVFLVTRGPGR